MNFLHLSWTSSISVCVYDSFPSNYKYTQIKLHLLNLRATITNMIKKNMISTTYLNACILHLWHNHISHIPHHIKSTFHIARLFWALVRKNKNITKIVREEVTKTDKDKDNKYREKENITSTNFQSGVVRILSLCIRNPLLHKRKEIYIKVKKMNKRSWSWFEYRQNVLKIQ